MQMLNACRKAKKGYFKNKKRLLDVIADCNPRMRHVPCLMTTKHIAHYSSTNYYTYCHLKRLPSLSTRNIINPFGHVLILKYKNVGCKL